MPNYGVNKSKHTDELHCLGNGNICVYEKGAEINQIFGLPYSSQSFFSSSFASDKGETLLSQSERTKGTDIWVHHLSDECSDYGSVSDCVGNLEPVFLREFLFDKPVQLNLFLQDTTLILDESLTVMKVPTGTPFYGTYCTEKDVFLKAVGSGNILLEKRDFGISIRIPEGRSWLRFLLANNIEELATMEGKLQNVSNEMLIKQRTEDWASFFRTIENNRRKETGNSNPLLDQIIDNIAVLQRTQQSAYGGMLAGNVYHLAYVRDQYGASRSMLKLGMFKESGAILLFYYKIFCKYGHINNAQAMGIDGIFHVHENDESEITGYLIIQAFDYLKYTSDNELVDLIMPLLIWAMKMQLSNVHHDMNSFNGDETYIAGGLVPRILIDDGSAEATMLTIKSGEVLIAYLRNSKFPDENLLLEWEEAIREMRLSYCENFVLDGKLVINNPSRRNNLIQKEFRNGVCERCNGYFGKIKRGANLSYLCPKCMENQNEVLRNDTVYILPAATLSHLYMDSDMLENKMLQDIVTQTAAWYFDYFSNLNSTESKLIVGYELPFVLIGAVKLSSPYTQELLKLSLDIMDESGSWAEYYKGKQPVHTRYRPWESGIYFEAIYDSISCLNCNSCEKGNNCGSCDVDNGER